MIKLTNEEKEYLVDKIQGQIQGLEFWIEQNLDDPNVEFQSLIETNDTLNVSRKILDKLNGGV
tara:strand:+ start:180 stop:368 length:189 start_codon:yes stop_codon:yes gene_type:complete